MDDVEGLWLVESEVDGVPGLDMMRFRNDFKGTANMYLIAFTRNDMGVVFKYAKDPAIRKLV